MFSLDNSDEKLKDWVKASQTGDFRQATTIGMNVIGRRLLTSYKTRYEYYRHDVVNKL